MEVEQWIQVQMRDTRVKASIVVRRVSALSTFYKWAIRNHLVENDPVYLAEKPKRPHRLPIWMEPDEQARFKQALHDNSDLPENVFGQTPETIMLTRQRYQVLFDLLQNSGLRISEALALRVSDVTVVGQYARSVRVIGKGDRERQIPLPAGFGEELAAWIGDMQQTDYIFCKEPGGDPPVPRTVRDYLKKIMKKAGIDKKITPHKLRHTYATRLLESGAALVDIQTLLGHADLKTTQIYTHVSTERITELVSRL
ncbi:tyrosine-type recombinase/integrase [Allochromatium warmingii]|nr:tyrosine-type recombinase/integrase [Allochromatium warmingii]